MRYICVSVKRDISHYLAGMVSTFESGPVPYPLQAQSTISVCGCTRSGKSTFVRRLLKEKDYMFEKTPHKVLYCYGIWSTDYSSMEDSMDFLEFHKGLPSFERVEEFADGHHNIVILDDLMAELCQSKTADCLFTKGAHHLNLTIIYINQNIFAQGRVMRNISLNVHYMVLFNNVRSIQQIALLGTQLNERANLIEAYTHATSLDPYGYLLLDMTPGGGTRGRWRTRIFKGQDTICYM
jgi:hypothetical protein